MADIHHKIIAALNDKILPIEDEFDALLQEIGDARFVLIGEATHGTREFYEMRAEITKRLISEKGFHAVTIEGDWPSAYPIHRYVMGEGNSEDWPFALAGFTRFPQWMWCNEVIPPFIKWLRQHNDKNPKNKKAGFYGLDLYSLYASIDVVIEYLTAIDPEAARRAKERYSCFELASDAERYGYLVNVEYQESCVKQAVQQLHELEQQAATYAKTLSEDEQEKYFYATQNSRLVKNAENYYRNMFKSHQSTWNIRDRHMAETVSELEKFLQKQNGTPAKIIVWAHNSHVGDARATEMGLQGEVNIGQLLREKYPNEVYNIGFSTYSGTVTAATDWGDPPEEKVVLPGFKESFEELFHDLNLTNFMLSLRDLTPKLDEYLSIPRLQRAIGVIYRPETERYSHYFFTRLALQFNCIIHLDQTTAIQPLKIETAEEKHHAQET